MCLKTVKKIRIDIGRILLLVRVYLSMSISIRNTTLSFCKPSLQNEMLCIESPKIMPILTEIPVDALKLDDI